MESVLLDVVLTWWLPDETRGKRGSPPYSHALSADSFTSQLAAELAPKLLSRFTRYVRVDTQSARDRTSSPSTPGQLELGRMVAEALGEAGLREAKLDPNGYVTATLPASGDG